MSQKYSRRQKSSSKNDKSAAPTKHIKTGFSALQKTVALIGSILSIIVASITISNALKGSNSKTTDKSTTTTTVIIKESDSDSKTDTSASTTYSSSASANNNYNSGSNNSNNNTYNNFIY